MKQYRFGFIVEQALGHKTHSLNLKKAIEREEAISAEWGFPSWEATGLAGKVNNWTVKAGLQSRQAVRRMHSNGRLDALFFHTQVTAVLAQDWLYRIPSIISLDATPLQYDELGEFYNHEASDGIAERIKWWLNRRAFHSAAHLVTWSNWARDGLIDGYSVDPDKITVIPPGVDVQAWARPTPRTYENGTIKLLFVGGNLNRKGGQLLLEAYRQLRAEQLAVELHLVTRDSVPSEPGVFVYNDMQPNTPELRQLFYDCDIFCLPTFGDCLAVVLGEAGATGMPLVATNVGGIVDLVHDNETGLLLEPGDTAALTQALRTLVTSPELRQRLGHTVRRLVRIQHDTNKNAGQIIELLQTIAGGRRIMGRQMVVSGIL